MSTTDGPLRAALHAEPPSMDPVVTDSPLRTTDPSLLWYFCYGANMNLPFLAERRHIVPAHCLRVRVPDHCITFNYTGFPYLEPGFATVIPREWLAADLSQLTPDIEGAALLLTHDQFAHIVGTEGGGGQAGVGYEVVEVTAILLDDEILPSDMTERTVVCKTLMTARSRLYALDQYRVWPSKRYHDIVLQGAELQRLTPAYLTFLRQHPWFSTQHSLRTRMGGLTVRAIGTLMGFPWVYYFFLWLRRPVPPLVHRWLSFAGRVFWRTHDLALQWVFGNGHSTRSYQQQITDMRQARQASV